MEEKKLTDELEGMYVSGKFNGEIIFNAIKTIYALQDESAKQKAEIERLTEELKVSERNLTVESRNYESSNHIVGLLKGENAELQKQVDEWNSAFIPTRARQQAVKDTAKKFADLVEFHSIARMNDGVEYFTISALCLKEILVEDFGFKYSELNGVEVE